MENVAKMLFGSPMPGRQLRYDSSFVCIAQEDCRENVFRARHLHG
jgi:hypothetical protein